MFDNLTNHGLLDRMTKDFALHRTIPIPGWAIMSRQQWYERMWRRWLSV